MSGRLPSEPECRCVDDAHARVCRWVKGRQDDLDTQACRRCRQMAAAETAATGPTPVTAFWPYVLALTALTSGAAALIHRRCPALNTTTAPPWQRRGRITDPLSLRKELPT